MSKSLLSFQLEVLFWSDTHSYMKKMNRSHMDFFNGHCFFHMFLLLLLTITSIMPVVINPKEIESCRHTTIILIGATGDLARKYLWQGFFELFIKEQARLTTFTFIGCARSDQDSGEIKLQKILLDVVSCDDISNISPGNCQILKKDFIKLTHYHMLKGEEMYASLNDKIEVFQRKAAKQAEGVGIGFISDRIFYLSIPPFAYLDTSRNIHKFCRPSTPYSGLRLVLEKPFGKDYASAKFMSDELAKHFREEEIYRVDHYLAKPIAMQVLPVRTNNVHLEMVLNRNHVEKVEVVLTETSDVKDRLEYYDEYGVIRDILQNHLTELLLLVTMDLPKNATNKEEIEQNKIRVLQKFQALSPGDILLGQYQNYGSEIQEGLQKSGSTHLTPTFAAVLLRINSKRWQGVPFVLMSGKKMDERHSYIRIVFKDRSFCLPYHTCKNRSELIFSLSHGPAKIPSILHTLNLPIYLQEGMFHEFSESDIANKNLTQYRAFSLIQNTNAYASVISSVFHRDRTGFIGTDHLLQSWNYWGQGLSVLGDNLPKLYPGGKGSFRNLSFQYDFKHIDFNDQTFSKSNQRVDLILSDEDINMVSHNMAQIPDTFLGNTLVSASTDSLIQRLVEDLANSALDAIRKRGIFHIAFSGGAGPLVLFSKLATVPYLFPWKQIHIWMVDERCVSSNHTEYNFHNLDERLLRFIDIPMSNIHPMPTYLFTDICNPDDLGSKLYENHMQKLISNQRLDFIVLGVGMDGHTASLFRGQNSLKERTRLVVLTPGREGDSIKQRMTLTFPAINKAREIAVFVLGSHKHEVLKVISNDETNADKWPITGVNPDQGTMTWYIDHDALFGKSLS
ncbi:GDH/6PGL endoplasmic bifunctional protein isoform X1 [Lingula anatina]|uniref:GDH/6PGL endoplasmic bifunctional protein isoform X1 n=2 Tax=Lingula anatina TaxID=7574 RepID=A0A1S3IQW8_LINAN|nr:GDH/6PGL endoplasmic bifunctional protein isoform X1 [Lingula anatina]|eukprot:XP_013399944.1 GDH/6PGL endoplasmic bifunctional protein isoform X1 [Lingula anatina]